MLSTTFLTGAVLLTACVAAPTSQQPYKYVVVLSVDGMHGSDVDKYVAIRPNSTIATLLQTGYEYQNAFTSAPSDSFPGTMAQYTGGSPRTHGIWYDDVWDWTWYAPGSNCAGPAGAEVLYDETIDYNDTLLFSGGINPANLPMAIVDGKCMPMYPHQRLLTNTVFQVTSAAGLESGYVDKHPSYDIVRGPSGSGLSVGYFPEIAAIPNTVADTESYDSLHVQAWLDFIDGSYPTNSTVYTGFTSGQMPSVMGGNFQSFSVAQKIVGYNADLSLSTALIGALDFVDNSVGQIVSKLEAKSYLSETLIIVASKHGQAPINKALLAKIDPDALFNATGVPTAFITTDDIGLVWLNSTSEIPAAVANLQAKAASLNIQELIYGQQLIDQGFGNPLTSSRVPMIIVRPTLGTIYTSPSATKVAEHGGLSDDDRHVACFVSNPNLKKQIFGQYVETKQVAATILQALGLNPNQLQAVVAEGTQVLPGLFGQGSWGDW